MVDQNQQRPHQERDRTVATNPHSTNQAPKTIQTSPEESEIEVQMGVRIGDVICNHLSDVMLDRTKLNELNKNIDEWIKDQPNHTAASRDYVLAQLKTACLVMESLYSRVAQTY
jgi:chemotaxis protein histidine kinase CheA